MCNLYNITTSQDAIREWTRALRDVLGNLEPSVDTIGVEVRGAYRFDIGSPPPIPSALHGAARAACSGTFPAPRTVGRSSAVRRAIVPIGGCSAGWWSSTVLDDAGYALAVALYVRVLAIWVERVDRCIRPLARFASPTAKVTLS